MNFSNSGYLPFISLIGKITLFIYLLSAFWGGHSINEVSHSVLFLFLLFELFNTIIFIYLLSLNVRIHNKFGNPFLKTKKDELLEEKISKIVYQILLKEVQKESLSNFEDLKIKVLIHEAKIGLREKDLKKEV